MARAEAYLHAEFHLDPPTVWPQYTNVTDRTGQTGDDRQWSDSIGRTVLQTVAQKLIVFLFPLYIFYVPDEEVDPFVISFQHLLQQN